MPIYSKRLSMTCLLILAMIFSIMGKLPECRCFQAPLANIDVQSSDLVSHEAKSKEMFYLDAMKAETFWRLAARRLSHLEWLKKVVPRADFTTLFLAYLEMLIVFPAIKKELLFRLGYTFKRAARVIIRFIERSDGKKQTSPFFYV